MRSLLCGLVAVVLTLGVAHAGDLEDEAKRQVDLAKQDFADGVFERAVNSCNSALRLDPAQREAFKIKGLALEQLGQEKEALAMLRAYDSLSSGLPPDPTVTEGITRLEQKLEVRVSPVPAILGVSGGTIAVAGLVTSIAAWARVEAEKSYGYYWGSTTEYQAQQETHIVGLVITGVGVGMGVAGLVAGLTQASRIRKNTRLESKTQATVLPWMGAGPEGAALGIVGRW